MTINRSNKTQDLFSQTLNRFLDDARFSANERLIMMAIHRDDEEFIPSNRMIAKRVGLHLNTVQRLVRSLADRGFLKELGRTIFGAVKWGVNIIISPTRRRRRNRSAKKRNRGVMSTAVHQNVAPYNIYGRSGCPPSSALNQNQIKKTVGCVDRTHPSGRKKSDFIHRCQQLEQFFYQRKGSNGKGAVYWPEFNRRVWQLIDKYGHGAPENLLRFLERTRGAPPFTRKLPFHEHNWSLIVERAFTPGSTGI